MSNAGMDLVLPATIEGLTTAQSRLRGYLSGQAVPEAAIARVEVVVEEIVMNVVMHGLEGPGPHAITLRVELAEAGCLLALEDTGRPFDLPAARPRAPDTSLEDAPIGGLGLTLIHRLTRDLAWQRLPEGRNRLTCTVPLDRGASPSG